MKMSITYLFKILRLSCFIVIPALGIMSCATDKDKQSFPVDILMDQGIKQAKIEQYQEASSKFKQLLDDYPDSPQRVMALLLLGDANYKRKEYTEAKANFKKFIELYPAHPMVDHAYYYKAMCDYSIMETAKRDQQPTKDALAEFEKLIPNFPNSSYREKSIQKKKECIERIARNIFEIGEYYFRNGVYQSSIKRFQALLEQYPDQKFNDEALFLLAESYYMEQNYEKAGKYYYQLMQQYPKNKFAKETRERLKSIRQ